MKSLRLRVLFIVACALTLTVPKVPAQTRPRLADYFKEIPVAALDARFVGATWVTTGFEDLDGDGNQDLIVMGFEHPGSGQTTFAPHPGRLFLGDGDGHFAIAPAGAFPVDTLQTVFCLPHFSDFNADNRKDMFLECRGWDTFQGPGEQNRLYLSRPEGGWRDATDTLPQLIDRNTAVSIGDINGRGLLDIFVGNGNQGSNRILSYTLLNTGSGQFTQMSTNIPVGPGQLLNPYTTRNFDTAGLIDLNDDGRPELVVGGTRNGMVGGMPTRHPATILWNRDGIFVENDMTALPAPARFPNTHGELSIKSIDVNQDGLMDLVAVGNQNPLHGWYLQIFVNHGNREFVDETVDRVPPGEDSAGTEGVDTATAGPGCDDCLQVLDFNQDGASDIFVGFSSDGTTKITPGQPLVWLNDGTGHFSTLKVGDFVAAGRETQQPNNLLGIRLVPTRNGFSLISVSYNGKIGNPLTVTGLLATKPYLLAK